MIKVYKHPKYFYDLESVTRFIDVEYVDNINKADFVAIASSHNEPVFEDSKGSTIPILYSYIREHPYEHDEYLKTQFASLSSAQDIIIFSLSSFEKLAPGRKNIIIDQFELDAYHRLFVNKECKTIDNHIGSSLRYLFLGGKANKNNRKPLYDLLMINKISDGGYNSLFGVTETLDDIKVDNNHYLGYPYDERLYRISNFSLIAETHFDGNQEFHPTEKTYRAIANKHPFIVASTPQFLTNLKSKGYRTFSDLINENYDFEKEHSKRLLQLVLALKQALKLDYTPFKSIADYNVQVLKNNAMNTLYNINNSLNNTKE
tara:strand:- start:391 stop:1341 length:951 start_codon:yes stop_codon:yes gene_type:complete